MVRLSVSSLSTLLAMSMALLLTACSSTPMRSVDDAPTKGRTSSRSAAPLNGLGNAPGNAAPALPPANSGRGGYYQNDGPPDKVPENIANIPDAQPKIEPYSVPGNRPYVVFGKSYTPITDEKPFLQRGVGTWYGKKFHGQRTSSGEIYDMFKMTAAHPTLPIPSFARVTNLSNGAKVIVRINDRGPFHSTRIVDLSYAAALKLGYLTNGSDMLEVERLLPADILTLQKDHQGAPVLPDSMAVAPLIAQAGPVSTPQKLAPFQLASSAPLADSSGMTNVVMESAPPSTYKNDAIGDLINRTASAEESERPPGFYLQFGAFAKLENAEALLARLLPRWSEEMPPIDIVVQGTMFRVFGGPFKDRAAAVAAQGRVPSSVQKPMVVQR